MPDDLAQMILDEVTLVSDLVQMTPNLDEVTLVSESGEITIVPRTLLIEKGALLNFDLNYNEANTILKLDVNCNMLRQLVRFMYDETPTFTKVEDAFQMYLFSKRKHISKLEEICLTYIIESIHTGGVKNVIALACKFNDSVVKYHCYKYFSTSFGKFMIDE
ncbi:uncharacterized protein LOC111629686 [Centruroides sculpturatus]|uniref:uncharacterized protein LOC111629686 n=1 Tax=Centruroides sculpturatus TaxID=218467 RepID=UPI000C6CA9A7|nr:uncharacterized protein LOC111629686 [Centruroides sculpturatus]XP_023229341.1 uncharacterized protein LOC111629686 [Centruroides sculpturatus]